MGSEQLAFDLTSRTSSDALYQKIVEQIRQWIMQGKLKDGDPLPSERELAQIFQVSRVPVREALKVLEYLGVIQNVRGKGMFVCKVDLMHLFHQVGFIIREEDPASILHQLFEARRILEGEAAALAAERRTEEDLFQMERAILALKHDIAAGKETEQVSLEFHKALIAAAHNEILIDLYRSLMEMLQFSIHRSHASEQRRKISLEEHRAILEQIRERAPSEARKAIQQHLQRADRDL